MGGPFDPPGRSRVNKKVANFCFGIFIQLGKITGKALGDGVCMCVCGGGGESIAPSSPQTWIGLTRQILLHWEAPAKI